MKTPPANLFPALLILFGCAVLTWDATAAGGRVLAWGKNDYGQINVPGNLTNATTVAAGYSHSLALRDDGTVVAWGKNLDGQTNVPTGLTDAVAIAAGTAHSLALRSNGTVVAWGFNSNGQTNVPPDTTNVIAAAGGLAHTLVLRKDGSVLGWGNNSSNQTNVLSDLTNVLAMAAGGSQNLVIVDNSTVIPSAPWFDPSPGSLQLTSTGLALRVKGLVGRGFMTLMGSSNLVNWDLVAFRSSVVGKFDYVDTSATNRPIRFYRVIEQR